MRLLVLIILAFTTTAVFSQTDTTLLSPDAFKKAIAGEDVQLVDVRTPDEYKKGHVKNATLIDWKKREHFEKQISKKLDPSKPVYLYCAAGVRSHAAAEFLRSKGFKLVYELDGGIDKWKEETKPLE